MRAYDDVQNLYYRVFCQNIFHLPPCADIQAFRGGRCSIFRVEDGRFLAFLRVLEQNKLFCLHLWKSFCALRKKFLPWFLIFLPWFLIFLPLFFFLKRSRFLEAQFIIYSIYSFYSLYSNHPLKKNNSFQDKMPIFAFYLPPFKHLPLHLPPI